MSTISERETAMNLSAEDRRSGGQWEVYSDDPAMLTKLRRAGHEPYKTNSTGGAFFRLPVGCVSFRSAGTRRGRGMSPNVHVLADSEAKRG